MIEEPPVFALASAMGRSAVAVLRLSGAGVDRILRQIAGPLPEPRRAVLRRIRSLDGELLDRGLVLWFPAPASFTGEACAELHLHGGRAVLRAVTGLLLQLGARPAEPGEFSRRSFLNGKRDLLEAEGIADLIDAETDSQRRQALDQMDGTLRALLDGWAGRLRRVLAFQEALIDFPDESAAELVEEELAGEIAGLATTLRAQIGEVGRGKKIREGLMIAVAGPPNVGKSSLVNALAGEDVAIVSPMAGTTRDTIETRVDLGGVLAILVDTAGLRDSDDPLEREGIRRAKKRLAEADIVVRVTVRGEPIGEPLGKEVPVLEVVNKSDIAPPPPGKLAVSARTGEGLDTLRTALVALVRDRVERSGPPPFTCERHRAALIDAAEALEAALTAGLPELRAEDLRTAMRSLGRITGQTSVEGLLDTIFGNFCIGK